MQNNAIAVRLFKSTPSTKYHCSYIYHDYDNNETNIQNMLKIFKKTTIKLGITSDSLLIIYIPKIVNAMLILNIINYCYLNNIKVLFEVITDKENLKSYNIPVVNTKQKTNNSKYDKRVEVYINNSCVIGEVEQEV